MRTIFADSTFWIGLLNPKDGLHALATSHRQLLTSCRIVTTDLVGIEVLNGLAGSGSGLRKSAIDMVQSWPKLPRLTVVPIGRELLSRAEDLYRRSSDKKWGIIDCVSFAVMAEMHIQDALTYDHHFVQASFNALMWQP